MGFHLIIHALGSLEVEIAGRPLPGLSGGKMPALLMLLAARPGHRHSRESLAEMLWPNLPLRSGRAHLRHAFFHLREALGDDGAEPFLLSGRDWLGFNPRSDFWMDALELAAAGRESPAADLAELEGRAGLCRGEFMAGFSLPDCQEYEDWLQGQREELRRQAVALLESLALHHEKDGRLDQALKHARRLSELDPLNEAGHCRIMRLCASSGQPAAAQAQYEACRAVLWKELGARPSEETAALLRQILKAQPPPLGPTVKDSALPAPPTERRQVTVLYCELTLAAAEDPEEAAEQLRGPQQRCIDLVCSRGGHVSQSHGGGLLVTFGYPDAREDAARRAVAAAQALCEAAAPAVVRCGIHAGLIATAPGLRAPDLVGRTSEQAIHLRLAAGEHGIALSEEAFRLVEGYVHCLPLGPRALVAGGRLVEVYRVEGSTGAPHRLAAAGERTPFVGRAAPMRRLLSLWRRACGGEPAVALVRGDPGIGKSRLVAELRREIAAREDCGVFESFCLAEHQGTPFSPFTGILSVAPAAPTSLEDPRPQLMEAMLEALLGPARRRPLLALVEDVQWADASTLELLRLLADRLKGERALILLTARPEFAPSWWPPSRALTLELAHLPEKPSRQLADSLAPGLPADEVERIVAQADGVPLFIEELARWRGTAKERGRGGSAVPATLHDLLMARIDQLGAARRLAQVAAACGRDFEPKLLAGVLKGDGLDVERGIQDLLRSGLALRVGERLQFKHALIQEAAYHSQARPIRRETHRRIAAILQRDFPNLCRRRPEILAHHLTEAGELEPAIRAWRAAGAAAVRCWSHHEARLHFSKALALLAQGAHGRERDRLELSLRLELGPQLLATTGFGSPEMRECYDRAYALCREGDDAEQLFHVVHGQWIGAGTYASYAEAAELAGRLERLARMSGRAELLLEAHVAWVATHFWMGNHAGVALHAEAARARCRDIDADAHVRTFGVDPEVYSLVFLGLSRFYLGWPDEADRLAQAAIAAAERSSHAGGKCVALNMQAILEGYRRRPQRVLEHSEVLATLGEAHRMPLWTAAAKSLRGWAWALQGKAEGAAQSLQGLQEIRKNLAGAEIMFGVVYLEAAAALGRSDRILAEVDALLEAAQRRCDGHVTSELHRLKGEALMAVSSKGGEAAEAILREALERARRSGSRLLELRAAASLFRWKRDAESRARLARLADLIEEGADHPDLLEARRLATDGHAG
jgi:DNA-binding SARP family transcriptional activator